MRNIGGSTFTNFRLTVGTPAEGSVTFMVDNNAGTIFTGTVTSNAPVVVNNILNDVQVVSSDFNNREKGIRIYSTGDDLLYVVVQNFITFLNHGVYLAYPCLSLGENVNRYEYGVVSVDDPSDRLTSQFLLVGCEDDTVITITCTDTVS